MDRFQLFFTDLLTRGGGWRDDSDDGRGLQQLHARVGAGFERDCFCERLRARAGAAGAI